MNRNCVYCGVTFFPESSVAYTFWAEHYDYHGQPYPNKGRELVHGGCEKAYWAFVGNA